METGMAENRMIELTATGGAVHACSCCGPASESADRAASAGIADAAAVTSSYGVTGMTCSHCVSSVTEELSELDGVRGVDVDLQVGGVSRVTVVSAAPLEAAAVAAAVSEAGYQLVAE
jgi:copper chaperone CopZ